METEESPGLKKGECPSIRKNRGADPRRGGSMVEKS